MKSWTLSAIGQYRSGLPYTMRVSSSIPKEYTTSRTTIVGLGPGMNGSGGDNRIYGTGNDGVSYSLGRNTFRYPAKWKLDLRLGKTFGMGGAASCNCSPRHSTSSTTRTSPELKPPAIPFRRAQPPVRCPRFVSSPERNHRQRQLQRRERSGHPFPLSGSASA